jgi:hypothetical protein
MFEDPRIGVVVYGSLLSPADLGDLFGDLSGRLRPVTVSGFQRRFNQAASWRETDGRHSAVLNVTPESGRWFNGLFVGDVSRSVFETYRQRERGYRLMEVTTDELEPYESQAVESGNIDLLERDALQAHGLVLTTVGRKTDAEILPIDSYVNRCLDGAAHWGQQFKRDFCATTLVNTGEPLGEYLSAED